MCETPPSSPTIVGIAVDTMVWSSAAISIPASSAEKMMLIRRRVSTMTGAAVSGGGGCMGAAPRSFDGAAGARHRGEGWEGASAGQAGGGGGPRLLDPGRERGGGGAGGTTGAG